MPALTSTCPLCSGKGHVALSQPLAETAAILQKHGPLTAQEIWRETKPVLHQAKRGRKAVRVIPHITAIHKRLNRLIQRKLVSVSETKYRLVG